MRRWENLHELIGSATVKYRNFAQGLTFEMMIGHANRQLQKMTDRYLLVRHDAQPLELNVVDNYQAGEIRPTKNLSGGESFIVSLSLALGLSHMASKNVRVDSLFLDEGFGTLDDKPLILPWKLFGSAAGRQADRRYFTRACLEGAYQHADPGYTSNWREKPDIGAGMRRAERYRAGRRGRLT